MMKCFECNKEVNNENYGYCHSCGKTVCMGCLVKKEHNYYCEVCMNEQRNDTKVVKSYYVSIVLVFMLLIAIVFGLMCGYRVYSVWSHSMSGKAKLAEAEYSRQILVAEAQAKKDSAKLTAESDVIRAAGIAKANKIIGNSLEKNEKYLEWKFIDELPLNKNQIIYLPTNSFLPILEANRIGK